MISSKERQEVVQRLRKIDYDDLMRRLGKEGLLCAFLDALGFRKHANWVDIAHYIADLIESAEQQTKCVAEVKIDSDELRQAVREAITTCCDINGYAILALAEEMEWRADNGGWFMVAPTLREYARRIRGLVQDDDDVQM